MYTFEAFDPDTFNPLDREDDFSDADLFATVHAALLSVPPFDIPAYMEADTWAKRAAEVAAMRQEAG